MSGRKQITVGILETGRPPEGLAHQFGDYPSMVSHWLAPLNAEFRSFSVLDGIMPDSRNDCDLWVITGSRFGVYENHGWIAPLSQFIRDCHNAGCKMIGICFGHQLIAQALGGRVQKSHKRLGAGSP